MERNRRHHEMVLLRMHAAWIRQIFVVQLMRWLISRSSMPTSPSLFSLLFSSVISVCVVQLLWWRYTCTSTLLIIHFILTFRFLHYRCFSCRWLRAFTLLLFIIIFVTFYLFHRYLLRVYDFSLTQSIVSAHSPCRLSLERILCVRRRHRTAFPYTYALCGA